MDLPMWAVVLPAKGTGLVPVEEGRERGKERGREGRSLALSVRSLM